ncbi:MAG: GNAT family N-acetyltransferase [Flavobacteriaceae bacterium]|nr:GNAT family N-acetyltransferase [Flavobacteriaceae bacterium]
MDITVKPFKELTKEELYELLSVRSKIFVVEQNCPYQDVDFKDQKALHVLGREEGKLIAYARIFNAGDYMKEACIGRVLVTKENRKRGLAYTIMKASIDVVKTSFNTNIMAVSAQQYLENFYNELGFKQIGDLYLEDGIPHIKMLYTES